MLLIFIMDTTWNLDIYVAKICLSGTFCCFRIYASCSGQLMTTERGQAAVCDGKSGTGRSKYPLCIINDQVKLIQQTSNFVQFAKRTEWLRVQKCMSS